MTTSTNTSTSNPFSTLGISEPLMKALSRVGYESPSPIQAESIPLLLSGRDLIGQAQTGTGKTAAFALPILTQLKPGSSHPGALVICPTRELAIQVAEAFQSYAHYIKDFHVLPIYGGQEMRTQLRQLKRGVDVIVGTPGRLLDHLKRGSLDLSALQTVVLDEADEMLRMGFIEDVESILAHAGGERQTVLFSATLPEPIRKVAQRFLNDPAHVRIQSSTATVESIDQHYWLLRNNQKLEALTRLLETEVFDGIIVFTRTRSTTTELAEKITARGYACAAINGDMSQTAREQTIRRLKQGAIDILVATDVAARGLDVDRISLVINYDIPHDTESYIHRVGRTGRAGRDGRAILFITHRERRLLRAIEKAAKRKIPPIQLPTDEEIATQRIELFKAGISKAMEARPAPIFTRLIQELKDETDASGTAIAAAMAEMLQRDRPLETPPSATPRPQNDDRKSKKTPTEKSVKPDDLDMDIYRLEVGREHDVTPGDIVGAIANEIEIDSKHIGHIGIQEDHCTVELPTGMPKEIFMHLKRVRVKGRPLNLSKVEKHTSKPRSYRKAGDKPRKKGHVKR